jgi:anti-anti-sigma factor
MKTEVVHAADATIVRMIGTLDMSTCSGVEAMLTSLLDSGTRKMVLNFADVDFVSSAGLRVLISTAKKLSAQGGGLRLCSLREQVQLVFDIAGLNAVIPTMADEAGATANF